MRFNPKAQLDSSQVEVREGGRGGGGMFPFPTGGGAKMGGGLGLVLVVAFILLTQCTGSGGLNSTTSGSGGTLGADNNSGSVFPFPLPDAPQANAVDMANVSGATGCPPGRTPTTTQNVPWSPRSTASRRSGTRRCLSSPRSGTSRPRRCSSAGRPRAAAGQRPLRWARSTVRPI